MKALIFTPPPDQPNVALTKLVRELKRRHVQLELVDINSRDGSAQAQLYDVFAAPAIILTRDDGAPVASWRHSLPQVDDLSYQLGIV